MNRVPECRAVLLAGATAVVCACAPTYRGHLLPPQPVEGTVIAQAPELDRAAMNDDFSVGNYQSAGEKLLAALELCRDTTCRPDARARILLHYGIVSSVLRKHKSAREAFQQALRQDPNIAPEWRYSNPIVVETFRDTLNELCVGLQSGSASFCPPPEPAPTACKDEGNAWDHRTFPGNPMPRRNLQDSPIPVSLANPSGVSVHRAVVFYCPFGCEKWSKLELDPNVGGFGGYLPCGSASRATGPLRAYIQILNTDGTVILQAGSPCSPLQTSITNVPSPDIAVEKRAAHCWMGSEDGYCVERSELGDFWCPNYPKDSGLNPGRN